jgi:hypothetical protein
VVIRGWDKLVNGDIIKITIWNDNALDSTNSAFNMYNNFGWGSDNRNVGGFTNYPDSTGYSAYPYSWD